MATSRAVLALVILSVLPACAPTQPMSTSTSPPRPSQSAVEPASHAPSDEPSDSTVPGSPSPSPRGEPDGLDAPDTLAPLSPDTLATVVTNDLVVRSLPEISDASTIHPVWLQEGVDLFVIDGPLYGDGYAWYRVAVLPHEFGNDVAPEEPLPRIGWVASGTPADPWVLPWRGDCPTADLEGVWRQRALVLLACFGDREITLEGERVGCSYVVPGMTTPSWLNTEFCELLPFDLPPDAHDLARTTFLYHQDEAVPLVTEESVLVRVVGHFDHPAARTCVEHAMSGHEPTPPELVLLDCRAAFVATEVTEISTR